MQEALGTIAVTGANRGIGAEIACELARRGYLVACLARNGQLPDCDEDLQPQMRAFVCDVTDEDQVREALTQANEAADGLLGIVNNAGILEQGPSATFSINAFRQILETNVTAAFGICQTAHPYLKASRGMIINIGSFWGRLGTRQHAAYCTSKAALEGLTRALAVEWARDGIRVLCVAPGYVETDLNREVLESDNFQAFIGRRAATGRPVPVLEIAKLVAGLFGENLSGLTGETIYVDGGHSINN